MTKPIVGVYVSDQLIKNLNLQNPNINTLNLMKANKTAKTNLYFFSLQDVNLKAKKIRGSYFDEKTELWTTASFPYPDIFYIRGGSQTKDVEGFRHFIQQLESLSTKRINSGPPFDKWNIYNILKNSPNLAPHLPETIIFNSPEDLREMLNNYDKVYAKACKGSKGKQVVRVKKITGLSYEYKYFRNGRLKRLKVNFNNLSFQLKNFFKTRPFIIQQAIDLPYIEESIYDLRAEVQRNGKGNLEVVEIMVRLSRPGAPVTQHASSYLFDHFFNKLLHYTSEETKALRKRIDEFLVEVYTSIEKVYGPYGEMGIDFALDKKNRLWFFEANSQPAKVSLVKAASEKTIRRAFLNPLEYAKFLMKTQK